MYYNFVEYYFTLEKRLPETHFFLAHHAHADGGQVPENVLEEINKPYADEHGIHLVRRMRRRHHLYGHGRLAVHLHPAQRDRGDRIWPYIAPVIDALREMGVSASFNGRNDLTIDGKKFSGNAQYRLGDCIVHHGSVVRHGH